MNCAIVIAASTGGPRALAQLIPALPAGLPAAVLVVQHMPAGFTQLLAQRLDRLSALAVREGMADEVVRAGTVYVAPGGMHMSLEPRGGALVLTMSDASPLRGVRPAADILFTAAARHFGHRLLGLVLTGMGQDGAEGLRAIREAGGWTAVQDPAGAVIASMPNAAAPHADAVLPLESMAGVLVERISRLAAQPSP